MQRLQDIQNQDNLKELVMLPSDEPRFIIDANERTISIPDGFTFLGVLNDHNAETVYFEIDRYYDQTDLSKKTCIVQYESRANKHGGFYPVTKLDITTVPGKIIFGWEVQNDATSCPGDLEFSVRFYSTKQDDDRIIFTGFVQGEILEELYSNPYIYTLPSDLEGMPLSLLEAMSYGNCCLTSDIPECAEVVEDKALLFRKSDVSDLKAKLQNACDHPEMEESYKAQAEEFICRKYNWDDVVEKTLKLYQR